MGPRELHAEPDQGGNYFWGVLPLGCNLGLSSGSKAGGRSRARTPPPIRCFVVRAGVSLRARLRRTDRRWIGSTGTGGNGGGNGGATGAACAAGAPLQSPLRRLTRLEYNNTVHQLLGDTSAPADRFPPDEISGGFNNNAAVLSVTPILAEGYQAAAEALAASAVRDLPALVGCDPAQTGEDKCAGQFIARFGRRAYRRPLETQESDRLTKLFKVGQANDGFAHGIELVLRAALQSPSFLYRLETASTPRAGETLVRLTQDETATRLAYLLWASMPDDRLFALADTGALGTPAQIARTARAMLDDAKARAGVIEFYRQWTGVTALDTVAKDPAVYPEFTAEVRAALRAEMPAFVEHVIWSADHKLGTMLTSPDAFITAPLAPLYGVSVPAGNRPVRVSLDSTRRAGLLTQAAVLAVHALPNQSSPIHRGKFIRERLLCDEPPAQPPNLMVTAPKIDAKSSTRELFAQHAADPACAICHKLMDPIGFGLEAFDGIGRYRTKDGDRTVDDQGSFEGTRDLDGPFRGGPALATKLAASAQAQQCVATQWYRFAFGRLDGPGDACSLEALGRAFAASGQDLKEMVVALTGTDAFLYRPAGDQTGASP